NRFSWPGKPREKELRQAGGEEDKGRRLRTLEPGTDRLGHEARCQHEHRTDGEHLKRIAQRREAIDVRKYNEIECESRQIDGQMCDASSEHRRKRSATALRECDAGEERASHQQRLLQDQQKSRRDDVACIAADWVE